MLDTRGAGGRGGRGRGVVRVVLGGGGGDALCVVWHVTLSSEATSKLREQIDSLVGNKKIKWVETSFAKGVDDFRVLQVLYK